TSGEVKAALRGAAQTGQGVSDAGSAQDILHKIEATTAQIRDELASPVTAIQGEAVSFMLDPLEQAIQCTVQVMRDERDQMAQISMTLGGDVPSASLYGRMAVHLDALLAEQLKRVTEDVRLAEVA